MRLKTLLAAGLVIGSVHPALGLCSAKFEGVANVGGGEYDPFSATDFRLRQSIRLRNTGTERCDFIVGFQRQPAQGHLAWFLHYRLELPSGETLLNEQDPPPIGAKYLVFTNVGPSQTASADYDLVLARGQFAFPGTYTDNKVSASLHNRDQVGNITPAAGDAVQLSVVQSVKASVAVSIAGVGHNTTLAFGALTSGQERSVVLQAQANYGYALTLRSANGSVMRLDPEVPGQDWAIPYSLRVNSKEIQLKPSATIQRPVPMFGLGSETHALSFRIEGPTDKRAGIYRDVVAVEIAIQP